jgi:DNA ligase-1
MPKSTKAPPPQQSSLHEMWGKKKDLKPVASKAELKVEPSAMEVDVPEEQQGECSAIG